MFVTYQVMSCRKSTELEEKFTIDELARMFDDENTSSFEKNKIYATIYCQLFPMMIKLQRSHSLLSNEEKAEICMYMLLCALKTYKKQKKIKFSTYFYQCLGNHFLTYTNKQKSNKRKIWFNLATDATALTDALNKLDKTITNREMKLLRIIKEHDSLDIYEKEYCACLLAGYTKSKEIADKLKLATRMQNISMDNPLYEKTNSKLIYKLKNSIKNKLRDKKYEFVTN